MFVLIGASPKSAAAYSDDFGDFEEADLDKWDEEEAAAEDVPKAEPSHVPTSHTDIAQQWTANVPQHGLQQPTFSQEGANKWITAGVEAALPSDSKEDARLEADFEKQRGEEGMVEIPWYMDPTAYQMPQDGAAGEGLLRKRQAEAPKTQHVLPDQPQAHKPSLHYIPAEPRRSSDSATLRLAPEPGYHQQDLGHHTWQESTATPGFDGQSRLHSPRDEGTPLPLPLLQAMGRINSQWQASPPRHTGLLPTRDLLSEAQAAPLPPSDTHADEVQAARHTADTAQQRNALAQEALAGRVLHGKSKLGSAEQCSPPLRSYSDAWTQMLEVALVCLRPQSLPYFRSFFATY